MADQLAKQGTLDTHFIEFNNNFLDSFNFCFNFYSFRPFFNNISIENNIRHTVRSINRSLIESHWATSKAVREPYCSTSEVIGQYTWTSFANVRQRRCISFDHHNHWIFCTKLINNLLPTASRLNLYSQGTFNNWTCALCNQGQDEIDHLCICSQTETEWSTINQKLIKMVSKFKAQNDLDFNVPSLIHALLPNDRSLPTMTEHCRLTWLKGLLHASTVAQSVATLKRPVSAIH